MSLRRVAAIVAVLVITAGSSASALQSYCNNKPTLDMYQSFGDQTHAWDMFGDLKRKLVMQFAPDIQGQRQSNDLVLDEHFIYSDGSCQERIWMLQPRADGSWRGTAADVAGEAQGELTGNAPHWRYDLRLPLNGRAWIVPFDYWMFLQDDKTMLNNALMSKFKFSLGDVSLFFHKE